MDNVIRHCEESVLQRGHASFDFISRPDIYAGFEGFLT